VERTDGSSSVQGILLHNWQKYRHSLSTSERTMRSGKLQGLLGLIKKGGLR